MQEVITANRLADGLVVFLAADGGWTEDFNAAVAVADAEARARALEVAAKAADANIVVEPYPIELELRAGHLAPKALRERIRASGPTVRLDLGKQAQDQAPTLAQRG